MVNKLRKAFWVSSFVASLFFLANVAVGPASAAVPQDGQQGAGHHRGMPTPDERLQMLTKQLNLTADEQAKIKPILVDEQKKMEDLRDDSSLSRQDRFQKMQQIRQDSSTQIRTNLDSDQQKKYDDMQKQMQERRHGNGGGNPGSGL
ncbi:MAG: hypothetical protein WBE20_14690 [Candidatus Acidiferrales bacterium]